MTAFSNQVIGGHYKILRQLGVGGFGKTYLAEDLHRLGSNCVIKKLTYSSNNPEELKKARELFEREGKTLLNLGKDGSIPYLFAYFQEDQEFYLVQDFIEGHSLSEELRFNGTFDDDMTREFLKEILAILEYVHDNGVVHRDLKPSNIMRCQADQKLMLIDFGGVKEMTSPTGGLNNSPNNIPSQFYTPGYAPKEQMDGYPRFNSDIYALGMIAVRALTGIEPNKLIRDADTGMVQWREEASEVSEQLAIIIDKMIQEDYRNRYQNVAEIIADLSTTPKTIIVIGQKGKSQTASSSVMSSMSSNSTISSIFESKISLLNISPKLALIILTPLIILGAFAYGFISFLHKQPSIPNIFKTPTPTPSGINPFLPPIKSPNSSPKSS